MFGFIGRIEVNDMRVMVEPRARNAAQVIDNMEFSRSPRFFAKLPDDQGNTEAVMQKPPVRDAIFREKLIEECMDFVGPPSKDAKRVFCMVLVVHTLIP
ncbi:hypothetical protein SBDP1_1580015 [Syntrophobacter sp. SbD1]|nr:hypothetical protein SBDP1_1580015 [Syntrophobacter sp. SbD1]